MIGTGGERLVARRSTVDGVPEPSRLRAPGLVGRVRETAALAEAFERGPAVVLVEGEAGVGKSRLVREFLASSGAAEPETLVAVCPPFREPYTLGPVVDAVRRVAAGVAGLGLSPLAGTLRPLFPEWEPDLPVVPEPLQDQLAARHRLFRGIAELLHKLGVAVLVVEDVHWADDATLDFLLFLVHLRPAPVGLVVTYRPEEVTADSALVRLSAHPPAGGTLARITLAPLDVHGTAELVSSMLDGGGVTDQFAAFLHQRTDGIPLAVEESVRLLHDRADLLRRDGGWVRRNLRHIAVPPTVRDAVLERAARLGPDARAVLHAAAVLGEPTDQATLLEVADRPAGVAGVTESLRSGLLREGPRGVLSLRHALATAALYESVPAPARRDLHLRAGRVLERLPGLPAAPLARHFREAGETDLWCRYAELAADSAMAAFDEATAAALMHDLLTSAALPVDTVVRLLDKAPFVSHTDPRRQRDLLDAVRSTLASGHLDPGAEARVRHQFGRMLIMAGERQAGRAELERAVPLLPPGSAEAVRAMTYLGWPNETTLPRGVHLEWLRRAARATAPTAPEDRLNVAVGRMTALLLLGEEQGWVEAAGMPDEAPTQAESQHLVNAHLNIGELAMCWGRYERARQGLARARALADRHQHGGVRNAIAVTEADLDWLTGGWDGLAGRLTVLTGDDEDSPSTRLEAQFVLGCLAAATGPWEMAEETLDRVLSETARHGPPEWLPRVAAVLAAGRLAAGRWGNALAVTDEPFGVVAGKGIWLWGTDIVPVRVAALLAASRTEEAAGVAAAFARGMRGRDAPAPQAAVVLSRAVLAEGQGEHARAATAFGRAAARWAALPRPYDALLAREGQARCLLAAGRSGDALPLLTEVHGGLSGLGARNDAARVAGVLRGQGVEVRPQRRMPWRGYGDELSPRELEVVRLVVTGRTNREIAAMLHRSPKTVTAQLSSAMRKLGVSSRTALAVSAVEIGVLAASERE